MDRDAGQRCAEDQARRSGTLRLGRDARLTTPKTAKPTASWVKRTLGVGFEQLLLYAVAVVLMGLMAAAAFYQPSGAWPLSIAAAACVLFANLDRIGEISVTTSGATMKRAEDSARKAELSVEQIKRMLKLNAETQLELVQRTGRFGEFSYQTTEHILMETVSLLEEVGVPSAEIEEIKERCWDHYILFDYIYAILGRGRAPENVSPEIYQEWKSLRDFDSLSTPDDLEAFIEKVGDQSDLRREFLDAYRYYSKYRTHKSPELWAKRELVEHITVSRHDESNNPTT